MKNPELADGRSNSELISEKIAGLKDWRGELLADLRDLIHAAVPDVLEEVKWRKPSNSMLGIPVWSYKGIMCTGETYKNKVKLTFARGASVPDPTSIFNSSLEGNMRRAVDFFEGDQPDAQAFKALIRAAANLNVSIQEAKKPNRKSAK